MGQQQVDFTAYRQQVAQEIGIVKEQLILSQMINQKLVQENQRLNAIVKESAPSESETES